MTRKIILGVIVMIALALTISGTPILSQPLQQQSAEGFVIPGLGAKPLAPMATSGDSNMYLTWWSNNTGDWEVLFRASTDGGKTFGDKINLSNSPGVISENAEIAAQGNNVYVSWWEHARNGTESVLRVSDDNGKTFGPLIKLSTNGTIGGSGAAG